MRVLGGAALLAAFAPAVAAAAGDATRGRELYATRCIGCHSIEADRIGPRHRGVIGRRAGSVQGFDYSPAVRVSTIVWSAATLERWLADPEATIPGQRMNYRVGGARDRADLIEYLASARQVRDSGASV
jgi:cytochrome c